MIFVAPSKIQGAYLARRHSQTSCIRSSESGTSCHNRLVASRHVAVVFAGAYDDCVGGDIAEALIAIGDEDEDDAEEVENW